MADFEGSGASAVVEGVARNAEDVTVAELLAAPPEPARPSTERTRWPVSREEFERLNEAAIAPEPPADATEVELAQTDDGAAEAAAEEMLEFPELSDEEGPSPAAPGTVAAFNGIPQTAFRPPDCTLAVGPQHVLVAVNTDLAAYTKAGALLFRWPNMTTLFSPVLPAGAGIFDPRVAYDHYAQRWIVIVAARRANPQGAWVLVAVSQSPNPAGAYWIWALDATLNGSAATSNWGDYPMLGFDQQAIYITFNMFAFNGGFQYAKLRILNKAELYSGGVGPGHSIRWFDFWGLRDPSNAVSFTVQPAAHFRGAGGNPPAYLINALWPSGNALTLWTLTNPLGLWTGAAPALTRAAVACRSYDLPPDAQQPGTTTRIETNDSRLLKAMYQFVGTTQRLWTCHTSKLTWPGEPEARSVLQWYEIDVPSRAVVQQNAFGASGTYYFFPAIHTDLNRNAYLVFGRSSANEFGQLRQTGRRVADAPGTLQGSALLGAGVAAYTGARWGDYFDMGRDGGDARTVWMYGETAGASNTWATRVGAARF